MKLILNILFMIYALMLPAFAEVSVNTLDVSVQLALDAPDGDSSVSNGLTYTKSHTISDDLNQANTLQVVTSNDLPGNQLAYLSYDTEKFTELISRSSLKYINPSG